MALITFDQFVKNHLGRGVDYDGVAKVQCVDLAKCYLKEVYGISAGAWGDAHSWYDEWTRYTDLLQKNFERIPNTPEFVPQKGDICVWKPSLSSGGWGHIAIASGEGDTTYFYSYDQNWTGKHDPCTKVRHNYSHFYGVLRAKDRTKITGTLPVLDTKGMKQGDVNLGVYELKSLLSLAESKGIIKTHISVDSGFGAGTAKVVNELLAEWGYRQNGVAGIGFVKKLVEKLSN